MSTVVPPEANRRQEDTLQQVLNTLSPEDQKHIEQVGAVSGAKHMLRQYSLPDGHRRSSSA